MVPEQLTHKKQDLWASSSYQPQQYPSPRIRSIICWVYKAWGRPVLEPEGCPPHVLISHKVSREITNILNLPQFGGWREIRHGLCMWGRGYKSLQYIGLAPSQSKISIYMSYDLISSWDLQNKGFFQRKDTKAVRNARSNFFHQRNLIFDHIWCDWSFRWPHNADYRFGLFYLPRSLPCCLSCAPALTVARPEVYSTSQQQSLEGTRIIFLQLSHPWEHLLSSKKHYKDQVINNKPRKQKSIISVRLPCLSFLGFEMQ